MFLSGSKSYEKKTLLTHLPLPGKDERGSPLRDLGTVEPRYNEPLYDEVLSITNDFLYNLKLTG